MKKILLEHQCSLNEYVMLFFALGLLLFIGILSFCESPRLQSVELGRMHESTNPDWKLWLNVPFPCSCTHSFFFPSRLSWYCRFYSLTCFVKLALIFCWGTKVRVMLMYAFRGKMLSQLCIPRLIWDINSSVIFGLYRTLFIYSSWRVVAQSRGAHYQADLHVFFRLFRSSS